MSILNQPSNPQGPTVDRVAIRLTEDAKRTFETMRLAYEQGLKQFWQHPRFNPQEISDALGDKAGELFQLHGILAATLKAANPSVELTNVETLGTFTVNENGTVTAARI